MKITDNLKINTFMILTCPHCATRYLLPANSLSAAGRKVKCSSCHEVWFQLPDEAEIEGAAGDPYEDIPQGVRPIPDGANLPTVHEEEAGEPMGRDRIMGYAAAAAVFFIVFVVLMIFHNGVAGKLPFTKSFYAMMGYHFPVPGEGLEFDTITAEAKPDSAGEKILISGKIVNKTAQTAQVPMIEAQMRSESGEVLDKWIIRPPASEITAQGDLSFSTDYLQGTPGVAHAINLQFIPNQN